MISLESGSGDRCIATLHAVRDVALMGLAVNWATGHSLELFFDLRARQGFSDLLDGLNSESWGKGG